MARVLLVLNARKALEKTSLSDFAKEMGIPLSDAEAVKAFVDIPEVPDDGLVLLEEATISGKKMKAGNILA